MLHTGKTHAERDQQFRYIAAQREDFHSSGEPRISVDTKKKELVGQFKNNGQMWCQEGEKVNDHDFPSDALGRAAPYGVYDPERNEGHVCVTTSSDTADLAVDAVRDWWRHNQPHYPQAKRLMIEADSGGSNEARSRRYIKGLQDFADGMGRHPFSLPVASVDSGQYLTATATEINSGNTSEFSGATEVRGNGNSTSGQAATTASQYSGSPMPNIPEIQQRSIQSVPLSPGQRMGVAIPRVDTISVGMDDDNVMIDEPSRWSANHGCSRLMKGALDVGKFHSHSDHYEFASLDQYFLEYDHYPVDAVIAELLYDGLDPLELPAMRHTRQGPQSRSAHG